MSVHGIEKLQMFNSSVIDMSDTTDLLDKIQKYLDHDKIIDEQEDFDKIDKYLFEAKYTLKLNLKTIRILDKEKSNKFVLPLYSPMDNDKFNKLINQPFNFLVYNDSIFSVNLFTTVEDSWDHEKKQSKWQKLFEECFLNYKNTRTDIDRKKKLIVNRRIKIGEVYQKLGKQIDDMKQQFIERSKKYNNPKILRFMASRTETNIKIIRDAEKIAKRKIEVLRNKKLISEPALFFERAVKLYLGKTGKDIIKDLHILGYTTSEDYNIAIEYLFFLLSLIEYRKEKYISPIIPILTFDDFKFGYEKTEILKVLTGHMFIHTVNVSKN